MEPRIVGNYLFFYKNMLNEILCYLGDCRIRIQETTEARRVLFLAWKDSPSTLLEIPVILRFCWGHIGIMENQIMENNMEAGS